MNDKIKAAQESLSQDLGFYADKPNKLSEIFGEAAQKPDVIAIGSASDNNGQYLVVFLGERPDEATAAKLPYEHEGFAVKYAVSGNFSLHKNKPSI